MTVRLARLAFLRGDTDGAIRLADDAAADASALNASAEEQAFDEYVAGEYRWQKGDISGADAHYQAALRAFPSYYLALAGRGRVAFAAGTSDRPSRSIGPRPRSSPSRSCWRTSATCIAWRATPRRRSSSTARWISSRTLGDTQAQVYNRELVLFEAAHGREAAQARSPLPRRSSRTARTSTAMTHSPGRCYADGRAAGGARRRPTSARTRDEATRSCSTTPA